MKLSDFDYDLPEHYIAQTPVEPRDSSRLMTLDRNTGNISHHHFQDITKFINPGDVLVMNTTRVIPARIAATRADTGGKMELLLLRKVDETHWRVLIGGKRGDVGMPIAFSVDGLTAEITEMLDDAERIVEFSQPIESWLEKLGTTPLPPYIHTRLENDDRYQTIYNQQQGSAAAPTAGLHFTPELLLKLRDNGVKMAYCTLHIGLDTFLPVKAEKIEQHKIHSEYAVLNTQNARTINEAKLDGGRIIAVGTTTSRTLETAGILSAGGNPGDPKSIENMCPWKPVTSFEADTNLFIYPGYKWRAVDAMITNFHLPKSSLLMMISAFAGRDEIRKAYELAKEENYRFFSFGDAMLIF